MVALNSVYRAHLHTSCYLLPDIYHTSHNIIKFASSPYQLVCALYTSVDVFRPLGRPRARRRDPDSMPSSSHLVVQLPSEAGSAGLPGPGPGGSGYSGPGSAASSLVPSPTYSQTGRAPAMVSTPRCTGRGGTGRTRDAAVCVGGSEADRVLLHVDWVSDGAARQSLGSGWRGR